MKRLYKVLAAMFAMALVLAAPDAVITSHAMGFLGDGHDSSEYTGPDTSTDDYWGGSSDSGSSDNGNSYDSGNGSADNGTSGNGASSAPAKDLNDMTVSAGGAQPFRIYMNKEHTAYDVIHCGIKQGTVTVTDTEGKPVAYKAVTVEQGEDKLWYMNITCAESVDTSKLTVTMSNTCASYVAKELVLNGLKVNGVVVLSTVKAK